MGSGETWIELDGLLEEFDALENTRERLLQEELSLQVSLIGLWFARAGPRQARLLGGCQLDLDLSRDGACHVALQREYISKIPFVLLRENVPIILGADQLRRDPHSLAGLHHRAFEDGI